MSLTARRHRSNASPPPARAAAEPLTVLAFPRDANPYQAHLYGALARLGVRARYVADLTSSRSLNLALMPVELLVWRLRGARILHIHWVFGFSLPGSADRPALRRLSYLWYAVVLRIARAGGLRVVWTLHNVLPHDRIFPDDVLARRRLVREASLVLAHSQASLEELERVAGRPREAHVIAHARFEDRAPVIRRRHATPRRVLVFGRMSVYKGLPELMDAFDESAPDTALALTLAGDCLEAPLRARLVEFAARHPGRVGLRLEHVPDDELPGLFADHDVQILPYRAATTSGAAVLGAQLGIPLAVTPLPTFAEIPGLRLGSGATELAASLRSLDAIPQERLDELSEQSLAWAAAHGTWDDMARATRRRLQEVIAS